MDYFEQVALLEKLDKESLCSAIRKVLQDQISDRSSRRNDLIHSLLR
jgi:hypothetical protein